MIYHFHDIGCNVWRRFQLQFHRHHIAPLSFLTINTFNNSYKIRRTYTLKIKHRITRCIFFNLNNTRMSIVLRYHIRKKHPQYQSQLGYYRQSRYCLPHLQNKYWKFHIFPVLSKKKIIFIMFNYYQRLLNPRWPPLVSICLPMSSKTAFKCEVCSRKCMMWKNFGIRALLEAIFKTNHSDRQSHGYIFFFYFIENCKTCNKPTVFTVM